MARLDTIGFNELAPTLRVLSDAGITVGDADWLRTSDNAKRLRALLDSEYELVNRNPFQLQVSEMLRRLRGAAEKMRWDIGEDVYERLAATAPAWPKGRLNFLSLRIRFGTGDDGVVETFTKHTDLIRDTFAPKFWRWEYLLAGKVPYKGTEVERLRLLAGNATHKPVIEWCTFDLDANRKRDSITSVRGPKSLADELLVFTWLFREYPPAINYKDNPAYFLGAYELNVPENDDEPWRRVPYVYRHTVTGKVSLNAHWRSDGYSNYSVPLLGECRS